MRKNSYTIILITFFLTGICDTSFGQWGGDQWWNIKHNWDQVTPWFRMMDISAANFGPNALPIPEMRDGRVETKFRFELRPEAHLSTGDQTFDIFTSFIAPIGKRASFELFIVPFDMYQLDTLTRDERLARERDPKGINGGDFWFGTNVQIIKGRAFPDLLFSAYFKTASGTGLSNARYTDTPAYYLLLQAGKDIFENDQFKLRLYGNIGTYVWQTFSDTNSQDDAISYGLGLHAYTEKYFAKAELAGYHGYLDNGDRPSVFRFQSGIKKNKYDLIFRYQAGLHDYKYHSFALAFVLKFVITLE